MPVRLICTRCLLYTSHPILGYSRWQHGEYLNAIVNWYYQQYQTDIKPEWLSLIHILGNNKITTDDVDMRALQWCVIETHRQASSNIQLQCSRCLATGEISSQQ